MAYKFDTHSVWDPNLPPPATAFASGWGTGSGGWALNGTSSGSDWFHSEFHSSNNGGTGKYDFAEDFGYDAPAGGPAGGAPGNPNPPTQRGNKTGSAVITESRFGGEKR